MQRFKKILFVNEVSSTATTTPVRAAQLARNNGAQLVLCHASKELPRTLTQLEGVLEQIHERQLLDKFENIDLADINTETKVLAGTPFIEIIKEVQRGGYDLVIKSAEGSSGAFSNLFGETDMRLMRKCPCPVWIIKPAKVGEYSGIVAAVDPDPEQPENAKLNESILKLATSLARQENCALHIVHTWYLQGEESLRSERTGMKKEEVDEIVADIEKKHRQWLEDLLELHDLDGIDIKVHLIKGDAGNVIPELVVKQRVEIVVMGTVARTGIAGFIVGNTAESILRNVDCSVLTVKPEGFVSPIKA